MSQLEFLGFGPTIYDAENNCLPRAPKTAT